MSRDLSPMTDLELGIAAKVTSARFPPATASKRFARDLGAGLIKSLSPRGRRFLAYVAHRYRRQYALSEDEKRWIDQWIAYVPSPPPVSLAVSVAIAEPSRQQSLFDEGAR